MNCEPRDLINMVRYNLYNLKQYGADSTRRATALQQHIVAELAGHTHELYKPLQNSDQSPEIKVVVVATAPAFVAVVVGRVAAWACMKGQAGFS